MLARTSVALLITLAACSDSSSNTPDAAAPVDAVPATVTTVTCPATPAASISTDDNMLVFIPTSASITVGQVIKFTMSLTHSVEADTTMSDPGLAVAKGATKCLMFTKAGTFGFHCNPHGFRGTVTVQ